LYHRQSKKRRPTWLSARAVFSLPPSKPSL
jgi:hypothetical protein